jgi:hypothetical protein
LIEWYANESGERKKAENRYCLGGHATPQEM